MAEQRFFNVGLPQLPTNTSKEIEPDLRDLYNAVRNLAYLVGQYGGFETPQEGFQSEQYVTTVAGPYKRRVYAKAQAAITYGQVVYFLPVAGELYVNLSTNAVANRPGHGICNTPGVTGVGAIAEIALPSCYVTSIGGLTPGASYWLDGVFGGITSVEPAGGSGLFRQALGIALTADVFFFHPDYGGQVV